MNRVNVMRNVCKLGNEINHVISIGAMSAVSTSISTLMLKKRIPTAQEFAVSFAVGAAATAVIDTTVDIGNAVINKMAAKKFSVSKSKAKSEAEAEDTEPENVEDENSEDSEDDDDNVVGIDIESGDVITDEDL